MASVNDPRHAQLERDVTALLNEHGFLVGSATYHNTMPPKLTDRLRLVDTPTGLYLRTRADRFAVHEKYPICFEWECKTREPWNKNTNLAVEAYPLAQHVFKAKLGVRILYVYRDQKLAIDAGFWCDSIPKIDRICIPPREQGVRGYLATAFPQTRIQEIASTKGSNDAFALISEQTVRGLDDWRIEIINELHPYLAQKTLFPEVAA